MKQKFLILYTALFCLLLIGNAAATTMTLSIAKGCMGQPIEIQINVADVSSMASFGADIIFDPAKLSFLDACAGKDTADWAIIRGQLNAENSLRIGGFAGSGTSVTGDASIAVIKFMVSAAGSDSTSLSAQNLVDGLSGAAIKNGRVDILEICPSPTPSTTPTPTPTPTSSPTPTPTASPSPTPTIPLLKIGNAEGCKGDVISLSISVNLADNLTAFGMDLSFDAEKIAFLRTRAGKDTTGWATVSGILATTETLRVGGFAGGGKPLSGNGELVCIDFVILEKGLDSVVVDAAKLIDGLKDATVVPGVINIREICPTPTPTPTPTLTPTPSPTVPPTITPTPSPTPSATPAANLSFSQVQACIGGEARILVHVANAAKMESFGLDLSFDEDVISYYRVAAGDQTSKWATIGGNMLSPGHLRIGGFAGSEGWLSGDGQIAQIDFFVKATSPQSTNLIPDKMIDGLKNANSTEGIIEIKICDTPTPTATPLPVPAHGWMSR